MTYVTMTGLRSVGVDKFVIDDDAHSESPSNPTICWDRSLHSVLISSRDHSPCHASVHRKIDSINSGAAVLKQCLGSRRGWKGCCCDWSENEQRSTASPTALC